MVLRERLNGAHVLAMQPQPQAHVKPILERFQAQLVEPDAVSGYERSVAEVVEDGSTPECQRLIKKRERLRISAMYGCGSCLVDERCESRAISSSFALEQQGISRQPAHQQPAVGMAAVAVLSNRPAQPVDVDW